MSQASTTSHITGVMTVGVPVTDQDRALEFYVGTLGFEKKMDAPMGEGRRWIVVAPPCPGATTIALVKAHDGLPAGVETGIRFATGDADADHAYLSARGVEVDEVRRWPGVPAMFSLRDQDRNGLEIVESP